MCVCMRVHMHVITSHFSSLFFFFNLNIDMTGFFFFLCLFYNNYLYLFQEPVLSKEQPAFQYSSHVSLQAPSGHMWQVTYVCLYKSLVAAR